MFHMNQSLKIVLATEPVDLRKRFNGLYTIACSVLADRRPTVEKPVIEPEEVLANPEAFKRIGEEVTEEFDVVPTKFFKRRTVRPKYVRIADRSLPPVVARENR